MEKSQRIRDLREWVDFLPVFIRVNRYITQNSGIDEEDCLPPTQMQAMILLKKYATVHMSLLAEYLVMPRQQLTKIIDVLVERGLVERKTDPNNRRMVLITLSKQGSDYLNTQLYSAKGAIARFNNILDSEQKAKIAEAFRLIREVLSSLDFA